jgi:aldose 1-epimerase
MSVAGRGQQLIPWPNRLRDGKYAFAGTERQLALTEPA